MSSPFVAEIRIFPFNFAPTGWAMCNGQLLPISQNTALFSLLGTQYGGDGKATFALPNLTGSAPMHTDQYAGQGQFPIGAQGGEQLPPRCSSRCRVHHFLQAKNTTAHHATSAIPTGSGLHEGGYSNNQGRVRSGRPLHHQCA